MSAPTSNFPLNAGRRHWLSAGTALSLALAGRQVLAATEGAGASAQAETRELDALYRAAVKDGGKLIVYAGGDTPTQQDSTKAAFAKRFPDVDIQIVVDYSKIHDVRVNHLLATGAPVPDVVQLQTVQNFPRWKKEGHLLAFKPAGFGGIYPQFRDSEGAWMAIGVLAFSILLDASVAGEGGLRTPKELIDPKWKGKIASSYPQDDDATLFLYKLYAQAYGWDWIGKLAAQDLLFARGTHSVREAIAAKRALVGTGASGSLTAVDAPVRWAVADGHPFMAWGQRAAILKRARHVNAAKLYMAWQVSRERQAVSYNGWSVRIDVRPAGNLKPVWQYANAHVQEFPAFMADRAQVERWRQTFVMMFGEVQGPPSPGVLGLQPALSRP